MGGKINYKIHNYCTRCREVFEEKGQRWCSICGRRLRSRSRQNMRENYDKLQN